MCHTTVEVRRLYFGQVTMPEWQCRNCRTIPPPLVRGDRDLLEAMHEKTGLAVGEQMVSSSIEAAPPQLLTGMQKILATT